MTFGEQQQQPSLYPSLNSFNNNTPNNLDNYNYSGWLQKKGEIGVVQTWKRRYFVMDLESIRYYLDDTKKQQKGAILWSSIANVDFTVFKISTDSRYFQINTNKGRIYYLFADEQMLALEWVNKLKSLCEMYKMKPILEEQLQQSQQQQDQDSSPELESQYYDQQQHQEFHQESNNSQYKDFLNYTTPYFSHFDSIMGSPTQPPIAVDSNGLSVKPPRPPGTLRELSVEVAREILPTEGKDLDIYYQSTVHFSNILLTSGPDYNLLSCYLILSILDWDNKKSQPLPYPCTPPYESDIVFQYFTYALSLTRSEVLQRWKSEGPSYCTQIDNFARKKRKNYSLLLENEDRETFLWRNVVLLNYIQRELLSGSRLGLIEDAILVLIDRFLENFESLPSYKFSASLFKETEAATVQQQQTMMTGIVSSDINPELIASGHVLQEKDRVLLKNFLSSYLLYQKLHLERKHNDKFYLDASLLQKYENVGIQFSQLLHQHPLLSKFQGQIQRLMYKVFFLWQKDLPLCETTATRDIMLYRHQKVFSRMLSKINNSTFPHLYLSILEVKDSLFRSIEKDIGQFDLNNIDSTSLDSIINPY